MRHLRRNADVELRDLERRAYSTKAPADVATWLAGLRRAGRFSITEEYEDQASEAFDRALAGDRLAATWLVFGGALSAADYGDFVDLTSPDDPDPQSYVWKALWIGKDMFVNADEVTPEGVAAAKRELALAADAALDLDYHKSVEHALASVKEIEKGERDFWRDIELQWDFREDGFAPNPYWGRQGAGLLLFSGDKVLLTLRSSEVNEPGTWGVPGGAVHADESPYDGALREAEEELGPIPPHVVFGEVVFQDGEFRYTTVFARMKRKDAKAWRPTLNWENDEAEWFPVDRLPDDLHFGVEFVRGRRPDLLKNPTNPEIQARILDGRAIDVSWWDLTPEGLYVVPENFDLDALPDGVDLCDARRQAWIWSIGRDSVNGDRLASTGQEFVDKPGWELLWLR